MVDHTDEGIKLANKGDVKGLSNLILKLQNKPTENAEHIQNLGALMETAFNKAQIKDKAINFSKPKKF